MHSPHLRVLLVAAVCTGVGAETRARADDHPHLEAGFRSAALLPWWESPSPLMDAMALGVPLWLDVGVAFTARWSLGVYGAYVVGIPKTNTNVLPGPARDDWKVGADVELRGVECARGWWVGFGAAYETLSLPSSSRVFRGVELARVDAGYDFFSGPARFGPFVTASLGAFLRSDRSPPTGQGTDSYPESIFHAWIGVGLRLNIDLARVSQ